jgi:5-amino-6-(5-phosphoribosylamino)uracil reductase
VKLLLPHPRTVTDTDLFDLYDRDDPHLRAGFVTSVDGAIAVDGRSSGLGSPADKAVFRALRTVADAVVVGAGTAREEDYGPVRYAETAAAWRASHGRSAQPPVVLVTRSGRVHERLLDGPVIVAAPEGVEVAHDDVIRTVEPRALVAALHARGLTRLLCEGGPSLLTDLLAAGAVDELCLTTAPLAVGDGPHLLGDVPATSLELLSLIHDDPGVLLARWSVVRSSA